jgi:hypothetical protein
VRDILLRELLEEWVSRHPYRFKVVYCVGSRWANVHMGAKSKTAYEPPPPPAGFASLSSAELVCLIVSPLHLLYITVLLYLCLIWVLIGLGERGEDCQACIPAVSKHAGDRVRTARRVRQAVRTQSRCRL